ncbi:MAG TPA: hypothetical protein VK438_03875 [Xanthobacteraceae bacterium]|nr:hypothetical protein [Xanthobacteraceae bacterium]
MNRDHNRDLSDIARVSERTISLIFDRRFDEAESMIEEARKHFPAGESHRLAALTAVLRNEMGDRDESIRLMREAVREKPTWLPHLYRLAIFLMDAERWLDADMALDELIHLCQQQNDFYFLDDARFRKIICMKSLGQFERIQTEKAKITPGTEVFIGSKRIGISDL